MARSRYGYRDNFGRWQKTVTANITKKLAKEAEEMQINLEQIVADKLKETHKANVVASYYPRARGEQAKVEYNKAKKAEEAEKNKGKYGEDRKRLSRKTLSYRHTGTLEEAIDTKIEKKGKYESKVSIIVKPIPYPDDGHRKSKNGDDGDESKPVTATQVYEWLRKGTNGSNKKYWFANKSGKTPNARNYSTPAHLFELHTSIQMKGFMKSLDLKKTYKNTRKYKIK